MTFQEIKKRVDKVNKKLFASGCSIEQVEEFWAECFQEARITEKQPKPGEIIFNASLTKVINNQLTLF